MTKFSKSFEMIGKIHSELFCQERFLPPNCQLRLRFHRGDPSFALMAKHADNKFNIVIDSAVLLVRQVQLASSLRLAHEKAALHSHYKFPVRKVKMLFFTHASGRQDLSVHNLVTGKLPRRVTFGFVESSNFHGHLSTSPFKFSHFNISNITLRVNGQALPVENGIELDFERGLYLQGYWSLLQGTNNLFNDDNIDIRPWGDYASGHTLFSFDLSAEMQSGCADHFELIRDGTVSMEVKLRKPITQSVTMVAHLEYDHLIEITKDGDVVTE